MKSKHLILIILAIIIADQALKFYIKLNFYAGEEHKVLGSWFRLHFVENEGMAWGWKFGGNIGKIILTLFRFVAVIWGSFLLKDFIAKKYHKGFIICAGLIYAGALGNLIDSMFYGLIFENSDPFMNNVAKIFPKGGGYTSFLYGKVVDMLYFPIIDTYYPNWIPYLGGKKFDFFEPVFNIADASISIGVIIILLFQNTFFKKEETITTIQETTTSNEDIVQAS
ncbi:MAG: lipoprotein signal peptidase [Deinococcales bacterium]|nr:lipoprotein signal peptidase [Chitinophagaceae bacterium]